MTETSCDSVRPSNGTIEANATEGGSAEGGEGTGSNTGGSSDQGNDGPPPEGGGFGG